MAVFALRALKILNASHNRVLSPEKGQALSFLTLYSRLTIFHDDHLNYSHVKQMALKRMGVLLGKALCVKNLGDGIPTQ